jgi:5-formyltetrahydrofolate cyclo-ligase
MIRKKKKELRKKVQEIRDELDPEQRRILSSQVSSNLWSVPEFVEAEIILFFIAFRSEVDTLPMIHRALEENKTVCVPCTDINDKSMVASRILDLDYDLFTGNYDIPEPKRECLRPLAAEKIDVILMPGVAFDMRGGRLGYGAGYYDRFIENCQPHCKLIALAFELQIVDRVPCADHDAPIHKIITEKRVIDCPSSCLLR